MGKTVGYDLATFTPRELKRIRARIERTLSAANGVAGKGWVSAVVWSREYAEDKPSNNGLVIRQTQQGMDAVVFRLVDGGVKFLGKVRVILP